MMSDRSSSTPAYAIETDGLCKAYSGRPVVQNLNLRIPTGSVYGFLGCNGAGKSTTTKMLMGMVVPDAGGVKLLGHHLPSMDPAVRSRIAYIAEGHPLYNWMTIRQAVRFTKAFYANWNDELVNQILDHFELPLKSKIRRLSKGQQAQVSLALAVAPQPELLILDDPTLGLDTVVRREFLESMIQIIQRQGRTILFSSHILGDVERVADRIGIMVNGKLQVDCTTDEFKESVSKLVLQFDHLLDEKTVFPDCSGLVGCRVRNRELEVILVNQNDRHRELAESLQPSSIESYSMNLEDTFLEYTRTKRKHIPLFIDQKDVETVR